MFTFTGGKVKNDMKNQHSLRCVDCGQFAKAEELLDREPWLGGLRHRYGYGCANPKEFEKIAPITEEQSEQFRRKISNRTKLIAVGIFVVSILAVYLMATI